jgi:nicotinamide-nucleotide amidase
MAESKIAELSKIMAPKGLTIAFAESATAGWLCSEFALTEHSGKVLKGGIVCYDADLKVSLLGVPRQLFEKFTPESMEVTQDLAERLDSKIPSDIQVAVTGLTAPGGSETAEKPVGTMFVFAMVKGKPCSFRKVFSGSREDIIHQTIQATAEMLIEAVQGLK